MVSDMCLLQQGYFGNSWNNVRLFQVSLRFHTTFGEIISSKSFYFSKYIYEGINHTYRTKKLLFLSWELRKFDGVVYSGAWDLR